MEASSHGLELERVAGVVFDVVGFTNLSIDHLDFHETIDAYRTAKHRLFTACVDASRQRAASPVAVVRSDDVEGRCVLETTTADTTVSVSTDGSSADLRFVATAADVAGGIRFEAHGLGRTSRCIAPLVGAHNLENLAVAAGMVAATHAAACHDALAAMQSFVGVPGRFERVRGVSASQSAVFVDYAHSPDAVARATRALAAAGEAPVVVVGAGGDRDVTKRPEMARAALDGAAHVVLTSDNPRSERPADILADMAAGIPADAADRVTVIERRDDAIAEAISRADGGPVLVLGKGHETYQEVEGRRYAFDDREEARRVLAARASGRRREDVPLLAGWTLDRLAAAAGGRVVTAPRVRPLGAISTDTRTIAPGDVFVALRGERFDGHRFVSDAAARGASAVIVDDASAAADESVPVIVVADTLRAMQQLATALLVAARARRDGCTVVGVTGSNGKTTTKELLAAIAGASDVSTLATAGNFNNHIGLPLTVGRITAHHRIAVLEMGANGPNDIFELAEIARHDVAVLTSIGLAHVEGFGGLDGVRRAKAGIVTGRPPRVLVAPHDEAGHPILRERIE
jgi:murE/murF fusion protein